MHVFAIFFALNIVRVGPEGVLDHKQAGACLELARVLGWTSDDASARLNQESYIRDTSLFKFETNSAVPPAWREDSISPCAELSGLLARSHILTVRGAG